MGVAIFVLSPIHVNVTKVRLKEQYRLMSDPTLLNEEIKIFGNKFFTLPVPIFVCGLPSFFKVFQNSVNRKKVLSHQTKCVLLISIALVHPKVNSIS